MSDKKITVTTAPKNRIVINKGGSYSGIDTLIELRDVDSLNKKNNDGLIYDAANNKFVVKETPFVNSSYQTANAAFNKANSANLLAYSVSISANAWANTKVSSVTGTLGQIYSSGGTTPTINLISTGVTATSYGGANQIPVITVDTFGRLTSAANVTVQGMDYPYANVIGASSNAWANTVGLSSNNYAGFMANSGNSWTQSIVASNLVTSRAYTNTSTTAANTYAGVMANSVNAYAFATYGTITNTVAAFAAANQAGVVANNANTYATATYVKKAGDTITGDLVVQGNVTISGNTTYVNTQTLLIGDSLITLNNDIPTNVAPSEDAGIEIKRGSSANVALLWNEGSDKWTFTNDGSNYRLLASNTDVESANNYAGAIANTKLANTSGVSFAGDLYFPSGNVGIGTTSPTYPLTIRNAVSNNGIRLEDSTYSGSVVLQARGYPVGGEQLVFRGAGAQSIAFYVGSNYSYMSYDGTNISIRATTGAPITIGNWLTNLPGYVVIDSTASANFRPLHLKGATGILDSYFDVTSSGGSDGNVFTIKSSGNVGIGTTSPSAKLDVAAGTSTSNTTSLLNLSQTWNNSGNTFTAIKTNVTDTASASGSLLMDLQVGGSSKFYIDKTGTIKLGTAGGYLFGSASLAFGVNDAASTINILKVYNTGGVSVGNGTSDPGFGNLNVRNSISLDVLADVILRRAASATLQLGAADAASPVAQTLQVQSVVAGTTNTAGANFTINGSRGTGTGAGGSLIFQVAPAGSSGSAQNALSAAMVISPGSSGPTLTFGRAFITNYGQNTATGQQGVCSIGFDGISGLLTIGNPSGIPTTSIPSGGRLAWSSGSNYNWADGDVFLTRDAANTLALRNGANAQAFNIYNTYTDASNYEVLRIVGVAGSRFQIWTDNAGTGVNRSLQLGAASIIFATSAGGVRWNIDTNGHFVAGSDNTFDIGASAANRPRNLYLSQNAYMSAGYANILATEYVGNSGNYVSVFRFAAGSTTSTQFYPGATSPLLQFGGTTSSFPALKRSGTDLHVRLADDSDFTNIVCKTITANSGIATGNSAIFTNTVITSTSTDQIIDSFTNTVWRSAQYNITMTSGTDYHTTQVSLIHDGSNAYITEYGTISTANNLGTFSATVAAGVVRLNVVPTFATTTINMIRTTNK